MSRVSPQACHIELRNARKARRMSQREMERRTGIHQARLSRIEKGQVEPKLSEAVQMARAVELDFVLAPRRALLAVLGVIRDFDGERRLTVPELILGRKAE
ncbi:MAG: helix-turn-helix transcriptional regulator [Gammaproteobacteria bacterium]|nr:helix-turn-helix transcriptional regulator [Gammaproteobacteria bacterium]